MTDIEKLCDEEISKHLALMQSWNPLDWPTADDLAEIDQIASAPRSKFCSCAIPDPVNISLLRRVMVCKSCDRDIEEGAE